MVILNRCINLNKHIHNRNIPQKTWAFSVLAGKESTEVGKTTDTQHYCSPHHNLIYENSTGWTKETRGTEKSLLMEDALTWHNGSLGPAFPHCVPTHLSSLSGPTCLDFPWTPHFPRHLLRNSYELWLESNYIGQQGLSSLQSKPGLDLGWREQLVKA